MSDELIQTYSKELKEFEDLIKTKSHMPQNIDKLLLLRYLNNCEYDLENASNLLYKNLKSRKNCPTLFKNRDISNDEFQATRKICQVFPMPKTTADGYEIVIFRLVDADPGKWNTKNILRSNVTMLDAKYLTDKELIRGSLAVIDLNGFGFRHFLKSFTTDIFTQHKYGRFIHQATPMKPVGFHVVHCPSFMRRFISFIGPRVRSNYMELAKFYDDFGTLQNTIPKELLPNEFGGCAGTIDDIHNNWVKLLESKRDYILNDDNWKLRDE